ncbi:SET domain-containing protein [Cryptosporidium canis]|uniref:SET domain-containing protein n=1 Tax=Cryptosporidium canis TaxID=195482 RepID=A0A9D5DIZ3_9CRYT|nr:SET domain-containing protein [Cryptosporidium canis]
MKEGQKLQGIRQERSPFKTQGPLSLNDDGDGSRVPGSAGKYWRYEQDDLHEEGWDEELGVPRVIVSETENLLHAMTRHIRNASHYGQRRLASVLNRSAVIYEGEICVFREDEKQGRARGAPPGLRSGGAGSSERDLSSRSEESLCALADEDLREGSTCTAVYPSEYPGKWEVEHFRVIYFGTLRESLCNLLGRLGAAGLHASCFTDIRLAQYCPTIFWNIARIFHWEIDLGILEILPSASPTTLKRRRGSLGETPGRPASRPTPGKKAGAGPQSRGVDAASEERDVSQELSKRLVEDLQRKVPYFVRNGIDCYTGPDSQAPKRWPPVGRAGESPSGRAARPPSSRPSSTSTTESSVSPSSTTPRGSRGPSTNTASQTESAHVP